MGDPLNRRDLEAARQLLLAVLELGGRSLLDEFVDWLERSADELGELARAPDRSYWLH